MRREESKLLIGCVADDFTGASDAASFLQKQGIRTLLYNGVPNQDATIEEGFSAVVIALKTRTDKREKAVFESIEALDWLINKEAKQLYIKYCSTFDSTKEGNIGPIIDAALERYNVKYTILCPALPINKRTVIDGCLYVDSIPLNESYMKNHPLTPMWDYDIARLMEPQGRYSSLKVNYKMLDLSTSELLEIIKEFGKDKDHFYIIPDYMNEEHAAKIIEVFGDNKILSGGSGILEQLGKKLYSNLQYKEVKRNEIQGVSGSGLILAGSCSRATLDQINYYQQKNGISLKIDPIKILNEEESIEDIWNFIKNVNGDVLIYSSDNINQVKEAQKFGKELISNLLESTMAELSKRAIDNGIKRIIVAGGETSGAVTMSLGYNSFIIGRSVAPGVPVMIPLNDLGVRLVLKSGNFGQEDFFIRALEFTKED